MKYFKEIKNEFITAIGFGYNGIEITKEEYDIILDKIIKMPKEEGYIFKLTEDLNYVKEKIEYVEEKIDETELKAQAYDILIGEVE